MIKTSAAVALLFAAHGAFACEYPQRIDVPDGASVSSSNLVNIGPQVHLERAADGRVNWELGVDGVAPSGQAQGTTPGQSSRLALTLDRALIEDAVSRIIQQIQRRLSGLSDQTLHDRLNRVGQVFTLVKGGRGGDRQAE